MEPSRWEELLARIASSSTAIQASLLTKEGGLEEWAASLGPMVDEDHDQPMPAATTLDDSKRPKVRPIQMGEFLQKFTCKRLLSLDKEDAAAVTASLR